MSYSSDHEVPSIEITHMEALVDKEIGVSNWHLIDQRRIDAFADTTEDWQFIHVSPERASAALPLGGTIAHGFLVLSLLSAMATEAIPPIRGTTMSMNYGFDKVRFLSPVPSGVRIRARYFVKDIERQDGDRFRIRYDVSMEIEGQPKPALVAEWIVLLLINN